MMRKKKAKKKRNFLFNFFNFFNNDPKSHFLSFSFSLVFATLIKWNTRLNTAKKNTNSERNEKILRPDDFILYHREKGDDDVSSVVFFPRLLPSSLLLRRVLIRSFGGCVIRVSVEPIQWLGQR